MRKHLFIPDTQVTPDTPTDHLRWIGEYIVDQKPEVIVMIGDWADMESLSQYDFGKLDFEGRRYINDIDAARKAMEVMLAPIEEYNRRAKSWKEKQYKPEMHLTLGNHEYRIVRAIQSDAKLDGTIGLMNLGYEDFGWTVHDFLKPVCIDLVHYAHYFANPLSGRPYGGQSIDTRLKNIGFSFSMGHQQVKMVGERYLTNGQRIRGLVCGSCLTPDHKVLTADLRYVELGSVKAGDELVSFDEHPSERRKRRYKKGTVNAVKRDTAECFLVTLDNGKQFRVTGDHLWLTRAGGQTAMRAGETYTWRTTDSLRRGTRIPKVLDYWEELDGRDAGYLAGMYDGEGTIYGRATGAKGGSVMQLSVSQREGPVLEKTKQILHDILGFESLTTTNQKDVASLRIKGGARNCAMMLGAIRPIRLLNKFRVEWLGSMQTKEDYRVASIEPIGEQEIVRIDIDAKTMIVEGYPHHNCYLHDEHYMGPQGNAYWRGIFIKHEVVNGQYDLMEVSLDYLCREYEGCHVWEFMQKKYPEIYEGSTWMKYQAQNAA